MRRTTVSEQVLNILFLFALIFIVFTPAIANDPFGGGIRGRVTTADNEPAAWVTILVKGSNRAVMTGEDGRFTIRNLAAGDYELEISLTGYEPVTKQVSVRDNAFTSVVINLRLSGKQLQEVVITSGPRITRSASNYAAKMPLKNLENAQVYSSVTRELLHEQMIFSVDDAVNNVPGIQKLWEATARSGDGGAYYSSRGFILQSQLRNGVAGNVTTRVDAANIESIEVLKGPSATLFGSTLTSYGGLINRVTKKPYKKFGGEVGYAGGSYGFNRVSADINTPLNQDKSVLFRLNAAWQNEGSFRDNGFDKGYFLAPTVSYQVNDRLSFLFETELYGGSNASKPFIFFYYPVDQLGVSRADEVKVDYKRSYAANDIFQEYRNANFFAEMKYKISEKWLSQTNISRTYSYSDGPYAYFYLVPNSVITGDANDIGADYMTRANQSTTASDMYVTEIQQNFIGEFHIGSLRNRLVAGLDYFHQKSNQLFYGADFDIIKLGDTIPNYTDFNRDNLNAVLMEGSAVWYWPYKFITSTYSAYVSDVISISDFIHLSAGVRVDHFNNKGNLNDQTGKYEGGYEQTAVSPRLGMVVQPLKDQLAVFVNYQNGFTNQTGQTEDNKTLKPEQANQVETGIKVNAWGGRLTGTASYYYIKVKDVVRPAANPLYSIQDGTQESKGVEAEVIANPVEGLNLVAGFAYNDSRFVKADSNVIGRRPETANSPYTANLWVSYRVPYGKWKGLGVGFGGNYASDNKIVNSVSMGVFTLPEYTILNATVFYEHPKFRIGVKVDNLTNKEYWIGYTTMNSQKLRSITGSIAFRF